MDDQQILALILLIHAGMLVAGLRMLLTMSREVRETVAMSRLTLDAGSKLLQQK